MDKSFKRTVVPKHKEVIPHCFKCNRLMEEGVLEYRCKCGNRMENIIGKVRWGRLIKRFV